MKLRQYQTTLITNTRNALIKYNSPCVVLPCGGGKSLICAEITKLATNKGNKVLFMAHRTELIEQITETFSSYNIDMKLVDVFMISQALKSNEDYKLIITDEAHHSIANTYLKVYEKYKDIKRVNVTATPCRLNGDSLSKTCDVLIKSVSVKWLIANNYLAPFEYYAPKINIDLPNIKRGEFNNAEMGFKSAVYGKVSNYIDPNKKTIIYCPNVEFSRSLAQTLDGAVHFDGNTSKKDRTDIINRFRNGDINILLNVDLIGEGFDVPDCEVVMLLRPTMSLSLFIQQSMRCMRYKKDKIAKIYDFVGNCFRHGLPDDERDWTLEGKVSVRNKSGEEDIIVRQCSKCLKVYAGNDRICPYCHEDNLLTRKQLEVKEKEELERITELNRKKKKIELWKCKTIADLKEYARNYGYDKGWVYIQAKIRKIRN